MSEIRRTSLSLTLFFHLNARSKFWNHWNPFRMEGALEYRDLLFFLGAILRRFPWFYHPHKIASLECPGFWDSCRREQKIGKGKTRRVDKRWVLELSSCTNSRSRIRRNFQEDTEIEDSKISLLTRRKNTKEKKRFSPISRSSLVILLPFLLWLSSDLFLPVRSSLLLFFPLHSLSLHIPVFPRTEVTVYTSTSMVYSMRTKESGMPSWTWLRECFVSLVWRHDHGNARFVIFFHSPPLRAFCPFYSFGSFLNFE